MKIVVRVGSVVLEIRGILGNQRMIYINFSLAIQICPGSSSWISWKSGMGLLISLKFEVLVVGASMGAELGFWFRDSRFDSSCEGLWFRLTIPVVSDGDIDIVIWIRAAPACPRWANDGGDAELNGVRTASK